MTTGQTREKAKGESFLNHLVHKIEKYRINECIDYKQLMESLTLTDVFWILRLKSINVAVHEETTSNKMESNRMTEFEKERKLILQRNASLSNFKKIVPLLQNLKEEIGKYYSSLMQSDYEHFIESFMNDLYEHYVELKDDLLKAIKTRRSIGEGEHVDEFFSEFQKALDVVKEIRIQIFNQEEKIIALLKAIDADPDSIFEVHLSDITRVLNVLEQPRYTRFLKRKDTPEKEGVRVVVKQYIPLLKESIRHLFEFSEEVFRSACEVFYICNTQKVYLEKMIHRLEYSASNKFNLELSLLFMFLDEKPVLMEPAKIIVEKHENLFKFMLATVKSNLQTYNVEILLELSDRKELKGIEEQYNFWDNKITYTPSEDITFFRLKKILALFRFYNATKNNVIPTEIDCLCRNFDYVLTETNLPDVSYDYVLDYLPKYLMDVFGFNQNNLAKLLDITAKTVAVKIKNGTIIRDYLWFWQAITGYSYTFLHGQTTIPFYGPTNSMKSFDYPKQAYQVTAYAEIIINRILALVKYNKTLAASSKVKKMQNKKYVLSSPYLKFISRKATELTSILCQKRNEIESLLEKKRTIQNDILIYERQLLNNNNHKNINGDRDIGDERLSKESLDKLNFRANEKISKWREEIVKIDRIILKTLIEISKRLKGSKRELNDAEMEEIKSILQKQNQFEEDELKQ